VRILLDNCMPRPFEQLLLGHEVSHTSRMGWSALENGELLTAAEAAGFQVMVTVDRSLEHQQTMRGRSISVVIIASVSNDVPTLASYAGAVLSAVMGLPPGSIVTVTDAS